MKLVLLLCAAACWSLTEGRRTCPSGQGFRYSYSGGCQPCLAFQYATSDTDQCQFCPRGYSNAAEGSTDSSCTKCRAGHFRDADSGNCLPCPKGTYSTTLEAASCTSCPGGKTTLYEGTFLPHLCRDVSCPPGHYFNWGISKCDPCVRGRYSTDGQSPFCVRCPIGYLTRQTGATSEDQCEAYQDFTPEERKGVIYW